MSIAVCTCVDFFTIVHVVMSNCSLQVGCVVSSHDLLMSLKGVSLCCFTVVGILEVSKAFLLEGWKVVELLTAMHSHKSMQALIIKFSRKSRPSDNLTCCT